MLSTAVFKYLKKRSLFFRNLTSAVGSEEREVSHTLGLVADWTGWRKFANAYLWAIRSVPWTSGESASIAKSIVQLWQSNEDVWFNLGLALLSLRADEEGKSIVVRCAEKHPRSSNVCGLLAVAAAHQNDLSGAYQNLREVVEIWREYRRGLDPGLAVWVNRELSKVTRGENRFLHYLCAELAVDRRLRPWQDLVTEYAT